MSGAQIGTPLGAPGTTWPRFEGLLMAQDVGDVLTDGRGNTFLATTRVLVF